MKEYNEDSIKRISRGELEKEYLRQQAMLKFITRAYAKLREMIEDFCFVYDNFKKEEGDE